MPVVDLNGAIEHLKSNIGIISVMSREMDLTQAADDLFKGLCCFHQEKTPSLTVTPSKGLYHCFGCGKSGDIVSFAQQYYNYTMMESVNWLAEQYNISLIKFEREPTPEEIEQTKLFAMNKGVATRLHDLLMAGDNRGYKYLSGRGINDEVMKTFGLGYSTSMSDPMDGNWSDEQRASALELDKTSMWKDAIVYPLHDAFGRIIGFKNRPYWDGRTTDDHGAKLPKFVGTSSKSPLHRDDHIYGLHIARKYIERGRGRLIGVEGQHDVIKLHQNEIKNVVGTDGTALNSDKLELLSDMGIMEIVLLFDGDAAGREASLKVATHAADLTSRITIKIASLPDGLDPDECIDKLGRMSIIMAIESAVYASQYVIDRLADSVGIKSVTQRIDFIKQAYPIIAKSSKSEQQFLTAYVADMVGIDPVTITDMIREEQARGAKSLLYNVNGERVLLSGIIHNEDFRAIALTEVTKDDFYLPRHQELFAMVKHMESTNIPVNLDTLRATMNNMALNQVFQEGTVIDEIYETFGDHVAMKEDIVEKSARRKLIKISDDLRMGAQDLRNRLVLVAEEHMDKVSDVVHSSMVDTTLDAKTGATGFMNTLLDKMKNPNKIVGIPLGANFANLTSILNGIQKKLLITIAANQSVGKTTLLSNWLNDIGITQGRKWKHFSLEMPASQLVQKIIGLRAGVDAQRIDRGNLTNEEFARVQAATLEYYNSGLTIDDASTTLEAIAAETRKSIRQDGIEGISIDYIQLMSKEKTKSRQKYEEEGEISGALKNDIAKAMNIPVVILSQMGRGAKDKDTPTAEDGAGAYKISQDSDVYMILFEKKQEEMDRYGLEKGNMNLFVDKNRLGAADIMVDIMFQKELQRMVEVV